MRQPDPATMSVLEAIEKRRSVRAYSPQPLDEDTIRALLHAAVCAPTAIHEEPWAFVVVQDRKLLKRISDRAKVLALESATGSREHRPLARTVDAKPAHLEMLSNPDFNIFYDAGTLIVIGARPMSRFVEADCWLAAENVMLAACARGLGTCCIGFALPALNDAAIKTELGIPREATAVAAIIVGVPSAVPPAVPRKPPEILRWLR